MTAQHVGYAISTLQSMLPASMASMASMVMMRLRRTTRKMAGGAT